MSLEGKLDKEYDLKTCVNSLIDNLFASENLKRGPGEYDKKISESLAILRDLTDDINKGYILEEEVEGNLAKGLEEFLIKSNASLEEERLTFRNSKRVTEKYEEIAEIGYDEIFRDPVIIKDFLNDIKNGDISLKEAGSYLIKGFENFYLKRRITLEQFKEFGEGARYLAGSFMWGGIENDLQSLEIRIAKGYVSKREVTPFLRSRFEELVEEKKEEIKELKAIIEKDPVKIKKEPGGEPEDNIQLSYLEDIYREGKKALKSIKKGKPIYFRGHTI